MGNGGPCILCNGMMFDSERTPMCGDCLLLMRETFGIKIVGKDIFYRVAPKRWIKCQWPFMKVKPRVK